MITKWLLTVVSLTVYIDLPALQIGTSFLLSLLYQIYLITVWPHLSSVSNWLDLFNELMVTAYLYGSMSLTDLQVSYPSKLNTSWYLITVIALTATVNSICVCWTLQRTVRAYLQERWGKKADKHPAAGVEDKVLVERGKETRAIRDEISIEGRTSVIVIEEIKEEAREEVKVEEHAKT